MPRCHRLTLIVVLMLCSFRLSVHGLEMMESERTGAIARHLLEQLAVAEKTEWTGSAEEAQGVADESGTIVVIPRSALMEDLRDPMVTTEQGAVLGGLYLSPGFSPLVEGKPVESEKLLSLPLKGEDGTTEELMYLRLCVQHRGGGEWRLLAFGKDAKPVIDAPFAASRETSNGKMDVRVVETNSDHRRLIVRVFGKYESGFSIAD